MQDIILASGSPRRKELLSRMGVSFTVVVSDYDEQLDDSRTTEEVAAELGLGKAQAVAKRFPDALVIGSDTIVTLGGRQLGKPKDLDDARQMLRAHAGQTVTVTTSVALACNNTGLTQVVTDTATVTFKPYDQTAVETYLATGDWRDKAGGWAIQSGAGPLIESVSGELDTIIGLPTKMLAQLLHAQGVTATPVILDIPR